MLKRYVEVRRRRAGGSNREGPAPHGLQLLYEQRQPGQVEARPRRVCALQSGGRLLPSKRKE